MFSKKAFITIFFFQQGDIVVDNVMAADISSFFRELGKLFNIRFVEMGVIVPGADIVNRRAAANFQVKKENIFHSHFRMLCHYMALMSTDSAVLRYMFDIFFPNRQVGPAHGLCSRRRRFAPSQRSPKCLEKKYALDSL